jgi:dynactin complex subunit
LHSILRKDTSNALTMHKASPRRVKTEGIDEAPPQSSVDLLNPGDRVEIRGELGIVRFIGATTFAPGRWIGVELDTPTGRNDGTIQGQKYFECRSNHGVFVRPSQVKLLSNFSPSMSSIIQSVKTTNEMMNDLSHSSLYGSKLETNSLENSPTPKAQPRLVREKRAENHREDLEEDDYLRPRIDELSRNYERLQGHLRESNEKLRRKDEELEEQLLLSQHLETRYRELEAQMVRWDLERRESTERETILRAQNERLAKKLDNLTSSLNEVSEGSSPNPNMSAITMSIDRSVPATSPIISPGRPLDGGASELQFIWDEERAVLRRRIKDLDGELILLRMRIYNLNYTRCDELWKNLKNGQKLQIPRME